MSFWKVDATARLGVAVLVCALFASDAPAGVIWSQYQGDAAHSGSVPVTVNPSAIQPAWSVTAGQLAQQSMIVGAVTDENYVYVAGNTVNTTDQVIALRRGDGTEAWRQSFVPYSGSISAPAVGNGKVYIHQWGHSGISGGNASQYPYLMGMNASNGAMSFATSHSGQWSSGSRPTVAGAQVFAAGGYYGGLDAYNGVSGAKQWFANVNQQYGWIPAADANNVYVYMGPASASPGPGIGTLYAFNRATGASAFTIQNPADSFTLYNGTVFLGQQNDAITATYSGTLTSFDLVNKTVRWRTPAGGNFNGQMAIDDGIVFAANGIELDLLDEATGAVIDKWFAPPGQALAGNIAVTDNLIFARTAQATHAISRDTLQSVWSTPTVGDLAIDGGLLLISNTGGVTAFAVPEPASAIVLVAAAASVMLRRRRRRAR